MRKTWAVGIGAILAMAMVGCGNATETITGSAGSGVTLYIVITTDSQSALNLVNTKNAGGDTSSATVAQGDKHSGTQVCTTSLSHENHSYAVTLYVSGSLPSAESSILAGACSQLQKDAGQPGSSDWTG